MSAPSNEHIILVAVHVTAETREKAQAALPHLIETPGVVIGKPGDAAVLEAWWVAEDDRADGSDCDSAIFVPRGAQADMNAQLDMYFDAQADLWAEEGYPYAETDVSGSYWPR